MGSAGIVRRRAGYGLAALFAGPCNADDLIIRHIADVEDRGGRQRTAAFPGRHVFVQKWPDECSIPAFHPWQPVLPYGRHRTVGQVDVLLGVVTVLAGCLSRDKHLARA